MTFVLSPIDDVQNLLDAGFTTGSGLVTAIAITMAETANTYDPKISNTTGNNPPSTDRGLREINSYWHPEVSDDCAYDAACSAKEMFRISKQGADFTPWATFNNGAYKKYMNASWMAVDAYQRVAAQKQLVAQAQAASTDFQRQLVVARGQVTTLQSQVDQLKQQIAQLTSADQTALAAVQKQLDDMTALKDQAVARATQAEAQLSKVTTAIEAYTTSVRTQLLGGST